MPFSDQTNTLQAAAISTAQTESAAQQTLTTAQQDLAALQGQIVAKQNAVTQSAAALTDATAKNVAAFTAFVQSAANDLGVPLPLTISAAPLAMPTPPAVPNA